MILQLYCESTAVIEQQCVTAVIKNQAQVVQRLGSIMTLINHKPVNKFIYPVYCDVIQWTMLSTL